VLLQPVAILEAWPIVVALLLIITFGKAVPAAILARLDGQRPSSALRAGALVGQSGEFSFVLASTGLTLGAVRPDTFSLAMGAVVISILTAGPLLAGARRLGDWLDARTGYPALPGDEPGAGLRRHAVILGYGRVGRSVARVLESRGFAWVAVDGDYAIAREARIAGAPIIYGEAGTQSVLDQARVKDAHALVVAMPDALATRQAIAPTRRPRRPIFASSARCASSWPNASSATSSCAMPCVASASATARWPPSWMRAAAKARTSPRRYARRARRASSPSEPAARSPAAPG
jgi:CPA2 family monovalent cation:H+ antiporter-2